MPVMLPTSTASSFEHDGYVFEIMDSIAEKLDGRYVDETSMKMFGTENSQKRIISQ